MIDSSEARHGLGQIMSGCESSFRCLRETFRRSFPKILHHKVAIYFGLTNIKIFGESPSESIFSRGVLTTAE